MAGSIKVRTDTVFLTQQWEREQHKYQGFEPDLSFGRFKEMREDPAIDIHLPIHPFIHSCMLDVGHRYSLSPERWEKEGED